MKRLVILALLSGLVAAGVTVPRITSVSAFSRSRAPLSKRVCTTKKVNGKRKKVCKTVKPKPTPRPACPNEEGGNCLGLLSPGTHQTVTFYPQITYTVPDGWTNDEDLPGNFLLIPPGFTLEGVNAGTSDYIGIYTAVAAPNGCNPGTAPGVDQTVAGIAQWIMANPGLVTTQAQDVSIGGLQGVVLDVRMAKSWSETCPYANGTPLVPLITGLPPSGLDHNLIPGLAIRLYLLKGPDGALAIEVDDVLDAGHLDTYSKIVQNLHFTT